MNTDTKETTDLEGLLSESIPCQGIKNLKVARTCDREAVLRFSNPHRCPTGNPDAPYKCVDCWMTLYQHLANTLASGNPLCCERCGVVCTTVLAFTDYRPF
jgi:DNA-directed RNA polymerase subunit RPC12/RpoP